MKILKKFIFAAFLTAILFIQISFADIRTSRRQCDGFLSNVKTVVQALALCLPVGLSSGCGSANVAPETPVPFTSTADRPEFVLSEPEKTFVVVVQNDNDPVSKNNTELFLQHLTYKYITLKNIQHLNPTGEIKSFITGKREIQYFASLGFNYDETYAVPYNLDSSVLTNDSLNLAMKKITRPTLENLRDSNGFLTMEYHPVEKNQVILYVTGDLTPETKRFLNKENLRKYRNQSLPANTELVLIIDSNMAGEIVSDLSDLENTLIIASSATDLNEDGKTPVVESDEKTYGALTYYLLRGLDEDLTFSQAYKYAASQPIFINTIYRTFRSDIRPEPPVAVFNRTGSSSVGRVRKPFDSNFYRAGDFNNDGLIKDLDNILLSSMLRLPKDLFIQMNRLQLGANKSDGIVRPIEFFDIDGNSVINIFDYFEQLKNQYSGKILPTKFSAHRAATINSSTKFQEVSDVENKFIKNNMYYNDIGYDRFVRKFLENLIDLKYVIAKRASSDRPDSEDLYIKSAPADSTDKERAFLEEFLMRINKGPTLDSSFTPVSK